MMTDQLKATNNSNEIHTLQQFFSCGNCIKRTNKTKTIKISLLILVLERIVEISKNLTNKSTKKKIHKTLPS